LNHASPAAVIVAWERAATDADFLDVLDSQFARPLVPSYVARASDRAVEQWSSGLGIQVSACRLGTYRFWLIPRAPRRP
jgi:hypothetical protein